MPPVPDRGLLSGVMLLLAAVALAKPSLHEAAAGRLQRLGMSRARAGSSRITRPWSGVLRRAGAARRRPPPLRLSAFAAELVAACLDAGATPAAALEAAGANLADSLGSSIARAGKALANGATAGEALAEDGPLAPLAAVFRRSSQTGSAMSEQLIGIAAQLRADEHYERLAKAQRVGVLSALPLGLCLLPAFLLLAVVPALIGHGTELLP
jgi:pilus assembly protein TadC